MLTHISINIGSSSNEHLSAIWKLTKVEGQGARDRIWCSELSTTPLLMEKQMDIVMSPVSKQHMLACTEYKS